MAIRRTQVDLTADGDGAAEVFTSEVVEGPILAVHRAYSVSFDATNVLTIQEANNDPAEVVLTETDNTTDGWIYPRVAVHDTVGVAITGTAEVPPVDRVHVADTLKMTLAGAVEADVLTVTVVWEGAE
jgi:hypothetical protein